MGAPLQLYLLTFNCGRASIDPQLFGSHLFQAWPEDNDSLPDIIAISLQEVAPISYAFLGGTFLAPYLHQFKHAVDVASSDYKELGIAYETLVVKNLGMTVLMLLVKKEVKERVGWIQTAGCGVGVWEMGNKGAAGVRIRIDEKELTFVAMHLAPAEHAVKRRNDDWKNIVQDLVFENVVNHPFQSQIAANTESEPLLSESTIADGDGIYKLENYIFLAGDFNYRTSNKGPSEHAHHTYPQPQGSRTVQSNDRESDLPERLQLEGLLERDQLNKELHANRTLHGFAEMPITFPPTYKYDNDVKMITPDHWPWSQHRWPSWCDRILYLPPVGIAPRRYDALPLVPSSDHRAVAFSVVIPAGAEGVVHGEYLRGHPPFLLSTDWKARRARARSLEILVGIASYLALTYEGYAILVGLLGGAIGGYLLLRSLI